MSELNRDPRAHRDDVTPLPIFIFGIAQRSGTHYLYDLLVQHPQCRPALSRTSWEGSWEDHLVENAGYLALFAHRVGISNRLNDATTYPLLMRSLGSGLAQFLRDVDGVGADPRRPVTKTPVTAFLDLFAELFPASPAILLVRDPRDLVASAVKTFAGTSADRWILEWRSGARRFMRFSKEHPDLAVVVRYEDLISDSETTLRRIFGRLDLDPDTYDYSVATRLPVRGSSQYAAPNVTWHPVPRSGDFTPLRRAEWLSPAVQRRITWRAASEMDVLGYAVSQPVAASGAAAAQQRLWSLRTRIGVTFGERRADWHDHRFYAWRRRKSGSHWG